MPLNEAELMERLGRLVVTTWNLDKALADAQREIDALKPKESADASEVK